MATSKISESCVFICLLGLTSVTYVTPINNSECKSAPLGMEDGRIKDSQITVTSFIKTAYGGQARLHKNIPKWGAWCADVSGGSMSKGNYDQYIQIDLLNLTKITRIATQGREHSGGREWAMYYKLSYRKDGGGWKFYRGKDQTVKVFPGNKDVSAVVRHDLDPTILARYIRVHPGYQMEYNACMRLELYGCVVKEVILSYSMPVGQTTKNGRVHYKDTSYNGVIINGFYKDGTGILTDGKFGPVDTKLSKELKGKGWVGWNVTKSQYIDITFEFSGVRKFTNVTLTVNVDKKRSNAVFNRSQIFFSSTKDSFSDTSFLQFCPKNFQAKDDPYNANVTLPLCENTARFMMLRLYFGRKWLVITEISFNSVTASGNEKKTLQDCSGDICTVTQSSTTAQKTTNSIAMFVGIAVTLAIVLIVLFVILTIYKRRRQASKLSTAVNTVGIENQAAEAETESSPNNNQGLDHVSPANGRTAPYEEVQIISPPSVYEMLNRNRPVRRETTNSDRSSGYVIPDNGRIAPYEVVQIVSPPVNDEPIRNGPDGRRATANSDCSSGYEEVQILSFSGYTELDNTKREQKDDAHYQKLVKK